MNSAEKQNRRRIHYVDHTLQKWLLLALVVMETVLVSLAIWSLYKALNTIIDEDMYRVHYSGDTQLLPLLIREGSVVLGWMLLANLTALFVANRIWVNFVQGILKKLTRLMQASQNLEFTHQNTVHGNHTVLEKARTWCDAQAQRLANRRALILSLPPTLPASTEARAQLAVRLKENEVRSDD